MHILSLILHKYIRLSFSGIETIEYTPNTATQIIIGTNGSGKSSLLNELSPLPPNKNDMQAGGYKQIKIEHRGQTYTLTSRYEKSVKHSFIHHVDSATDIELNEGGTGAAQKILIEKVFGLDVELLRIWSGRTRFTALAPIKRRDWILKLSGSDLDTAMALYKLAKDTTRDKQALERHFVKRLAEETADIADQNRIKSLEDTVTELTQKLNGLLEQKNNNLPSAAHVKYNIEALEKEFFDCTAEALTLRLVKPSFMTAVNDLPQLDGFIDGHVARIELTEQQLKDIYKEKEDINTALEALTKNGVTEINELRTLNETLLAEQKILIAETPVYQKIREFDIKRLVGAYDSCKHQVMELLSTLEDNSEGYYTRDRRNAAQAKVLEYSNYIAQAERRIAGLEHAISHYHKAVEETCPKCDFHFKPGMGEFKLETAQAEVADLQEKSRKAKDKLDACNTYLERTREYLSQLNLLKKLIADNPNLNALWETLVEEGLYKVNPKSHLPTVQHFGQQIENCYQINVLADQINLNAAVLASVENSAKSQSSFNQDYLHSLDVKIGQTIATIDRLRAELRAANRFKQDVTKSYQATRRAHEIRIEIAQQYKTMVEAELNQTLSKHIQEHQLILANANNALNQITRHDAVIKELEAQKQDATESLLNYQCIQDALSPVNGLISRYIQNFLDVFIEDVNMIIADIWTSDMEVLSCAVESNDVNCKFPLSINEGYLVTPDIADASDGQVDVIDFAFRMVVGQYLKMYDYPLFLDELAPTLDEQHRVNLIRYLNKLMEDGTYSQMFMISHYASNHYAFANAEILMMDDRNIVNKPAVFNQHVKITYSGIDRVA
ncbi:MAG: hypothetical protein [Bacteriophage sp.]|nr:MAG: hypothetical protein [Bacteriophage sp.]